MAETLAEKADIGASRRAPDDDLDGSGGWRWGEVAHALRLSTSPAALPRLTGLDLAACWQGADREWGVGGDFHDAFVAHGALHVVIGDVSGSGPAAAARSGAFRHTVRAVAMSVPGAGPAEILTRANAALMGELDDFHFATAALVVLPVGARSAASVASAGHPRPILVAPGAAPRPVPVSGALLGVLADPQITERGLALPPGSRLVLYTDGVTEAGRTRGELGEDGLCRVLERVRAADTAAEVAAAVVAEADARRGAGEPADDVAVVVIGAER